MHARTRRSRRPTRRDGQNGRGRTAPVPDAPGTGFGRVSRGIVPECRNKVGYFGTGLISLAGAGCEEKKLQAFSGC